MKKRNKKYNPRKAIQQHEGLNKKYIVFAVDRIAMGVINKNGVPIKINDLTYDTLQHSLCDRNACIGCIYKEGDNTYFNQREIVLTRCTGKDAMKHINDITAECCDEVGLDNVLGRYYLMTGDLEFEWTDALVYKVLEEAGSFKFLCTKTEYVKYELEDMERNMATFDPKASQIGGTHYSRLEIQPIEVIKGLRLSWNLANAFKYISRFEHKNRYQDLQKAYDYIARESHDGFENFHTSKSNISREITKKYREQFPNPRVRALLDDIENLHRKRWSKTNPDHPTDWKLDINTILFDINQLCKEKYGVGAF